MLFERSCVVRHAVEEAPDRLLVERLGLLPVTEPRSEEHYGRIYVHAGHVAGATQGEPVGALHVVAHELFHAVQRGYEAVGGASGKGFREGTATTFGVTVDAGGVALAPDRAASGTRYPEAMMKTLDR